MLITNILKHLFLYKSVICISHLCIKIILVYMPFEPIFKNGNTDSFIFRKIIQQSAVHGNTDDQNTFDRLD